MKPVSATQNNNFDLLRLVAAFFVLVSHSYGLQGKGLLQPGLWYAGKHLILSDIGLAIFFTISGFLVTQSLANSNSLKHYAIKRFLRIMPALVVVNAACILLGGFVTSLPVKSYFTNTETWLYLIKNCSFIHLQYTLPGVFENLRDNSINGSLWTLWIEVECYLLLLLTAHFIVVRKWLFLACFFAFEAARVYMRILHKIEVKGLDLEPDFIYGTYFYLGSLFYCFKDDLRFRWFYANLLLAVALVTVYTIFQPITEAIFFAYCFITIGTSRQFFCLKGYDLSYGLYLYAFPVQQLLLFISNSQMPVWQHILLSTFIGLLLAFLSWTFVEKPFLQLKKRFA